MHRCRCASKIDKNDTDEKFHQVAQDFVEDLCNVVQLPEFPGAAILLDWFARVLINTLKDSEQTSGLRKEALKNGTDMVLRKMLVSMAGAIAARLKTSLRTFHELPQYSYIHPLQHVPEGEEQYAPGHSEAAAKDVAVCELSRVKYSTKLLREDAARMFGGHVLLEGSWLDHRKTLTLDCHIRAAVQQQIANMQQGHIEDKEEFEATVEREYQVLVMQLLINYFNNHDDASAGALASHIGCWASAMKSKPEICAFVCKQCSQRPAMQNTRVVVLPDEELQLAYSRLVQLHSLFEPTRFDHMLDCIGQTMMDESPQLRTRALKALTRVVNADIAVLMSERAKAFIARGVLDRSPSVREATLDLMGQHMQELPELIDQYYDTIHDRIQDIATSVRKRVVSIFRDVLIKWPTCSKSVNMCTDLVQRIRDEEDSIRDLVTKTLTQLWFVPLDEMEARGIDISVVANQIVEVVDTPSGHEWVKEMLEKVLAESTKEKGKKVSKAKQPLYVVCSKICAQLVADIQAFEQSENIVHVLPKWMSALWMFASVNGSLVGSHIPALQSYLADQQLAGTKETQKVVEAVTKIVDAGLSSMQNPDAVLLEGIEKSLGVLIVSSGRSQGVLQASVKCLCNIVNKRTHNYTLPEEMLKRFYHYGQNPNNNDDGLLVRNLLMMGYFCRYYNYDAPDNLDDHEDHPGLFGEDTEAAAELQVGNINKVTLDLLLKYYRSEPKGLLVKHRALQSMGQVFCRVPSMMMAPAADAVFKECFTSPEPKMKSQLLRNVATYLDSETTAMLANLRDADKGKDGAEARNADSGVASALIQKYLEPIKIACVDNSPDVRVEAANVMSYVVTQRLVAPFHCVAPLVALGCDCVEQSRETAHKLLVTIYEKHPEFVGGKAVEGIKLAFDFLKKSTQVPSLKCSDSESGVKRLYKVLQPDRKRRGAFVECLFSKMSKYIEEGGQGDIKFHIFLVEQLGTLPYSYRDEPLFIIYKISEVIGLHRDAKLQELRRYAKPEEYQESNSTGEGSDQVVRCLNQVALIGMLIVLKTHLKTTHMLSDSACETFAPSTRDAKESNKPLTIFNENPELDLTSLRPFLLQKVTPEALTTAYELAKQMVEHDLANDFTLEKKKEKRKRTPKEKVTTPSSSAKKPKAQGRPKKATKKRRKVALGSDEEEEEDYDSDY